MDFRCFKRQMRSSVLSLVSSIVGSVRLGLINRDYIGWSSATRIDFSGLSVQDMQMKFRSLGLDLEFPFLIQTAISTLRPVFIPAKPDTAAKPATWVDAVWYLGLSKNRFTSFGTPFHAVSPSPLPLLMSAALFFVAGQAILTMRLEESRIGFHAFWPVVVLAVLVVWLNEVFAEEAQGHHTLEVQQGFRIGIILFIVSEAMLFLSFFWGFFHVSLNPSTWIAFFPPDGVVVFYWWRIPLLNTLILLSSGLSLTIAHKLLFLNDRRSRAASWVEWYYRISRVNRQDLVWLDRERAIRLHKGTTPTYDAYTISGVNRYADDLRSPKIAYRALRIAYDFFPNDVAGFRQYLIGGNFASIWTLDTVLRGFVFLGFQSFEYIQSMFTIRTSVYGSVFFTLTGLHGFHVFVGAVMLAVCVIMMWVPKTWSAESRLSELAGFNQPFWWGHRVAFEGAAWYWHFVDVVWLFVFLIVYWWGGLPN